MPTSRQRYYSSTSLCKPRDNYFVIGLGFLRLICGLVCFALMPMAIAADDAFSEETLRAGFYSKSFPDFSAEDVEITVKLLSEELGKDVGVNSLVTVYSDIEAMRRDFEAGTINFVVASSILLVTQFDTNLMSDGFRLVLLDGLADRLLVLGQRKPDKANFDSYLGQRLVLAEYDPMTELYLDFLSWSHFKQGYRSSFKVLKPEKKAHQLLLMLFFNQADVTCVYQNHYQTAVEMNPQLQERLKVLAQVENLPQGMGLFHKSTPRAFREKVIRESSKLHERPRGQQLLQLFKSERAIRASADDMAAVIELNNALKRLSGNQ